MRALAHWNPFGQVSFRGDVDDFFAGFFAEPGRTTRRSDRRITPAVEVFLRGDDLIVRADLPGIDPKDVELTVESDVLTIKGERRAVDEKNRSGELYREVSYGSFVRTVELPAGVDPESIVATYRDGVLEVTTKAPKGIVPKKVPIAIH